MSYYIASIKHTNKGHEHITFWGKNQCGYTMVFGDQMGEYGESEAKQLNNGDSCIAVPMAAVETLFSPEPYYKPGARFYDQRGPVIDNTRKNWNALIKASMPEGRFQKPKPETFKGTCRGIYTA